MTGEQKATVACILGICVAITICIIGAFLLYNGYKIHHHVKTVKIDVETRVVNP